ncbi:hypothetical protein ACH4T9_21320 [Micromonospora sp. NPDC020750]|uniref:hypothetical protein n=1 Tax=unclassified Micromonospora TaxID=2617518 RepID=UPI00378F9A45
MESRSLRRFWLPFNTCVARVDAMAHAPAAFRRLGDRLASRGVDGGVATSGRCSIRVGVAVVVRGPGRARREAFSITSSAHGLPAQYTVIVDPGSGALLGYEAVLTTTAGRLNVTIPAVTSYRSYLVAEYALLPG